MSAAINRFSLESAAPPGVAVELAARHVSAASLETRGGRPAIAAHAAEPLPEGALVPGLVALNIRDRASVAAALGRVLERVGRPRRVGLIVPDPAAKVSLVRFEHVPARAQDLDQIVRWQVRKAAPFPLEDAQISFVPGVRAADGQEFIVTLARRDIIQEYEGLCADAGAHAGLVDICTFNVINAALSGSDAPSADWLLVNVAPDYASIAILRGGDLLFFRSRVADTEGTLADLVHQTAMYYEDRLKGAGLSRVLLSGTSASGSALAADVEQARRSLQDRLGTAVETVDPRAAVTLTDRIVAAPAFLDTITPVVGLLLRGREAA
jgi:Tfp pilus assembly PilM family ATPase